jgi:hypothetical protein
VTLAEAMAEMTKMPFMVETPLCLQMLVVDDRDTD